MAKSKGRRRPGRQLSYRKVRNTIGHGDVMLFKGKGPLSWIIRKGSGSDYSHAAVASWEDERLMIYHAVFKGLRHVPASEAVDKYDGQVDWWSVEPGTHEGLDRGGIVAEAGEHVGKKFAVWGMIKLMFLMLIGRYRGTKDPDKAPEAMFCSWYVSRCYRVGADVDICEGAEDACTSPAMIQNGGVLMRRGVLHEDPEGALDDEPATDRSAS